MAKRAVVVLADGFEEIEAVTAVDLLNRAGIEVTVIGLDKKAVRGAHGLNVTADAVLADYDKEYDAIVLPGGQPGTDNLSKSELLLTQLRTAFDQGLLLAAICAAPTVLEKAGVLKERKVTCYPGMEKLIPSAVRSPDPVVTDGNVLTSRGVGTAIPFALKIVEYLCDSKVADAVAEKILFVP